MMHDDNEEFQKLLLTHPAYRPAEVHPGWRTAAIIGWIVVALLTAMAARGGELGRRSQTAATVISEEFLSVMEEIESGRDAGAVGDNGRARGSFQFWAVAWAQVDTLRRSAGLATWPYSNGATNRVTARLYAAQYLRWLESSLADALRRSPTRPELYAAWNLGPAGFRARGFLLRNCPAHTRRAAGKIDNHG